MTSVNPLASAGADVTAALHREMRVRFGAVPHTIADAVLDEDGFVLSHQAFLFTTDAGVRFHYARGDGIVASVPEPRCEDDFRLYLWGTVFGAVAWLNGYFALHASAVAVGQRAVAFTADSGVGKSTLAAALSAHGLAHICDDTLAVYPSGGQPLAIPDRKPLKLWEDAFNFVAADRLEPIVSMPGKSYALAARRAADALPLGDLIVLADGHEIALTPVRGADKLSVVVDAMYRAFIPCALGWRSAYTKHLMAVASGIGIWRLTRPRSADPQTFAATARRIASLIDSLPVRS